MNRPEGEFTTLDAQKAITARHVQAQGGTVTKTYSDDGKSGTNLIRTGWRALLADAKAGAFDAVCVTYMSRLGRGDAATIAEYLLKEAGVSVVSVHEQYTDDEAGYVSKSVDRLVDGMYVVQVRKHTKTKMREMFDNGFVCGHVPFGYTKEAAGEPVRSKDGRAKDPPQHAVPCPQHADTVRQAFALYLQTGTAARVRDFLRMATGRMWTTTEAKHLLTDERYTGVACFGQWRKEDAHPALISHETFAQARELASKTAGRYISRTADDYTYYLKERVHCPHCGCLFTQAGHLGRSKRQHYYVCRTANRRQGAQCPVVRVSAERLHRTVLEFMRHAATHKTVMHRLIAQSGGWSGAGEDLKTHRGTLGKQKQALEMRIGNYVRAIGDGRDSPALLAALDKAEVERVQLQEQIEAADSEIFAATVQRPTAELVQEAWGRILEIWDVLDEDERAQLMAAMVEATSKESVLLDLAPFPVEGQTAHSQCIELSDKVGAGVGLEPTTSGL